MKKENNDENSGPLTSLPVNRLTATDCNTDRSCQKLSVISFTLFLIADGFAVASLCMPDWIVTNVGGK